jgi:hypothetical protein
LITTNIQAAPFSVPSTLICDHKEKITKFLNEKFNETLESIAVIDGADNLVLSIWTSDQGTITVVVGDGEHACVAYSGNKLIKVPKTSKNNVS